jgi:hypothetical protein
MSTIRTRTTVLTQYQIDIVIAALSSFNVDKDLCGIHPELQQRLRDAHHALETDILNEDGFGLSVVVFESSDDE